jgi:hypothetical protein
VREAPPYYVVKRGRAFWQPTKEMREIGAKAAALGPDGPEARSLAWRLYKEWLAHRMSHDKEWRFALADKKPVAE